MSAALCAMVVALSLCDAVCIGCRYENSIASSLVIFKLKCCEFLVVIYEFVQVLAIREKRLFSVGVIHHHYYYQFYSTSPLFLRRFEAFGRSKVGDQFRDCSPSFS